MSSLRAYVNRHLIDLQATTLLWVIPRKLDGSLAGVTYTAATLSFSFHGSVATQLEKTGTVGLNSASFSIASGDFENAGRYSWQVVVTEGGLTYTVAHGDMYILESKE